LWSIPWKEFTMLRVRPAAALLASALLVLSACSDLPTTPSRSRPTPIAVEPSPSVYTPLLLPPGAKWGHYFNSFNTDRVLAVDAYQYYDGHVSGRGIFVLPSVGVGRLNVTKIESTSSDCVPWGTPCADAPEPKIPESSTVSGDGTVNGMPMTFTLELQSHMWPPQGWTPGSDPGTNYDTAALTVCPVGGTCTTTTFYGELHHEPT
jgi:hypothetical protein